MAAAAAFATAVASHLGGDVVAGFKDLVRRRFSGDRRAESALVAVERNPADPAASQVLTQALAHYAGSDPEFRRLLAETVNHMEYHIDLSHSANWRVGGDNYGDINTPITDNRVYQSGQYVAGRDVRIDQSRVELGFDQMAPVRNATGIPRAIMVIGLLVSLAGVAVFAWGLYDFFMAATSGALDSSTGGPPPALAPIVQKCATGFGICFVGIALTTIGGVFRPKSRRS
jgi:hypothetical protein